MWKHFLTNTLRFSWEGVREKEYFHAFCLRSLACFRVKTEDTEVYHHTVLAIDQ